MGTEVFWVRLFCSEFDDPRWLAIEQMPDADAVQIIYVRMLTLAGRCNADGLLMLHESLPYDVTTLSAVLRRTVPVVQFALATLEKFKFIEMVDNVIAITAWDQLQPTGELARIAHRREKDKLRKREERANKKNLLLPSKDTSTDCPPKSQTTKIELKSVKATTHTPSMSEVVVITPEFDAILGLIPVSEMNKRLRKVIDDSVNTVGEAVTMSNIRYALANHNPSKGELGGMIYAAIEHDFASAKREIAKAAEKAQLAACVRQEKAEASQREQEEQEHRETQAQQAVWLALKPEDQAILARQAQNKFPFLLDSAETPESVLGNTAVTITKILATMFAKGELSLPSSYA